MDSKILPNAQQTMAAGGEERQSCSSLFMSSECVADNLCMPCENEGKYLEARGFCENCKEFLCNECFIYHTKPTITRHHVLTDSIVRTVTKLPNTNKVSEKCAEHGDELIRYYCESHGHLCCNICINIHHRNCDDVVYIPKVSKDMKGSQEYNDLNQQLKTLENKSRKIICQMKNNIELITLSHAKVRNAREAFRREINDILDRLDKDMNNRAEELETEDLEKMNLVSDMCTATMTKIQTMASQVESAQDCSLYIAAKRAKRQLASVKVNLKDAEDTEVREFRFEPNQKLAEILTSSDAFGKLKEAAETDIKVTYMKDIGVKSSKDLNECRVTGLALLARHKLVVVDNNNKKIKVVDTRKNKLTSRLQLSFAPWDVTKVSDTKVAVTVPEEEKVVLVKTAPGLIVESEIKVAGRCYGVAYTDEALIVSFLDTFPDKVEVIDMKGNVLQSICSNSNGEWIFSAPRYVVLDPGGTTMYVSNWENETIVSLALDGQVMSICTDSKLSQPGKIAVDGSGRIYICNIGNNDLYLTTVDFRTVRKVQTTSSGLVSPSCISFDEEKQVLYIGMEKSYVKVFQLSSRNDSSCSEDTYRLTDSNISKYTHFYTSNE